MKNVLLLVTALCVAYHFVVLDACCAGEHDSCGQADHSPHVGHDHDHHHDRHDHSHGHQDFHEGHAAATLGRAVAKSFETPAIPLAGIDSLARTDALVPRRGFAETANPARIERAAPARWRELYRALGAFLA